MVQASDTPRKIKRPLQKSGKTTTKTEPQSKKIKDSTNPNGKQTVKKIKTIQKIKTCGDEQSPKAQETKKGNITESPNDHTDPAPLFTKLSQFFTQRKSASNSFFTFSFQKVGGHNLIMYCILNDNLYVGITKGKKSQMKNDVAKKILSDFGCKEHDLSQTYENTHLLENAFANMICWNPAAVLDLALPNIDYKRNPEKSIRNKTTVTASVDGNIIGEFENANFLLAQADAAIAIIKHQEYSPTFVNYIRGNRLTAEDRAKLETVAEDMKHADSEKWVTCQVPADAVDDVIMDETSGGVLGDSIQYPVMTLNKICSDNKLDTPTFTFETFNLTDLVPHHECKCQVDTLETCAAANSKKDAKIEAVKHMIDLLKKEKNITVNQYKVGTKRESIGAADPISNLSYFFQALDQEYEIVTSVVEFNSAGQQLFEATFTSSGYESVTTSGTSKKKAKEECANKMIPILENFYGDLNTVRQIKMNEKDKVVRNEIFMAKRAAAEGKV